jgi:hypothetical protein
MIRQVSKIVRSWSVVGRVFLRTSQLMSSGELHALPDKELGRSLFEVRGRFTVEWRPGRRRHSYHKMNHCRPEQLFFFGLR